MIQNTFCQNIKDNTKKPNIILIMVDDMGWSDIGAYGGEIPTPNIDALATNGIKFNQFYNNARCCPTRASLLTGLYAHQAGIGMMTETSNSEFNWGTPGYQGYLNKNNVTIAEVLKQQGYQTFMAGKWHLGMYGKEKWPLQRGFDRYYGTLEGASSYFKPQGQRGITIDNNEVITINQPNYYTTDVYTEKAIDYIKESSKNPFFLYLAYNAPHWPLQAKEKDIEKFKNYYLKGWDEIRKERLKKQLDMGLIDASWGLSARDNRVRIWEKLTQEEKEKVAYRMAVYAAQVYSVDENIGKLTSYLKSAGKLQNTIIFFLSDNGACAEAYDELGSREDRFINDPNYSGAVSYGIGWANASNTPFYEYKVKSYEGGISTPLIVSYPKFTKNNGKIVKTVGTIRDIMPTIIELTGAKYPETFHNGEVIYKLEGQSLVPTIIKGKQTNQDYLFWEHSDFGAVRHGDWKLVYDNIKKTKALFNLATDRTETTNLIESNAELAKKLDEKWQQWANTHFVYPKKIKK
ncbi:arylsulfatase [Flavobacterium nackdongense]|uniref:Arylsulfatase n=2 Tax=Flavobacterium nackdongense TaxID=2547394 RepID=A0A4P6YC64_9FLAO|nr:arylsulfatase [Flavobacterium nackdongense]